MATPSPHRTCPSSTRLELRCPACAKAMVIDGPEAAVTLTHCPRPSCHNVVLVCAGEALGRPQWPRSDEPVALSFDDFCAGYSGTRRPGPLGAQMACASIVVFFIATPAVMMSIAADTGPALLAAVLALTMPAILLGMVMLGAGLGDLHDTHVLRRERRRLRAIRRQSFPQARWQPARASRPRAVPLAPPPSIG